MIEGARWAVARGRGAPLPWRRVRVEIAQLQEPLAVAALTRCFAQVERCGSFPADARQAAVLAGRARIAAALLVLVSAGGLARRRGCAVLGSCGYSGPRRPRCAPRVYAGSASC